jgi:hypothetical protein
MLAVHHRLATLSTTGGTLLVELRRKKVFHESAYSVNRLLIERVPLGRRIVASMTGVTVETLVAVEITIVAVAVAVAVVIVIVAIAVDLMIAEVAVVNLIVAVAFETTVAPTARATLDSTVKIATVTI